jgi:hypothetical protein
MRFSTVSGLLSVIKNREGCWLLIALIVRQRRETICNDFLSTWMRLSHLFFEKPRKDKGTGKAVFSLQD